MIFFKTGIKVLLRADSWREGMDAFLSKSLARKSMISQCQYQNECSTLPTSSCEKQVGIEREMTSPPASSCNKHARFAPAMIQLEEEFGTDNETASPPASS